MHRGFKLSLEDVEFPSLAQIEGEKIFRKHASAVEAVLGSFVRNGALDGDRMQAHWFPKLPCDVFISHARADTDVAIQLAGWLKYRLGLTPFVDSTAWGYADDLLRLIDNEYCWSRERKSYDYASRNRSTSHVHMMLSVAIAQMIDKAECVFFLNSPASLTPSDVILGGDGFTGSPWIYAEIQMTRLIQKRTKDAHRTGVKIAKALTESLTIQHSVQVDHLTPIDVDDLISWGKVKDESDSRIHALDILYKIVP